ncbi:MAG: glycosyltransferase family 2 protein [Candidatus Erginobacter occultus]|nr:glycosyltransferase family 2 protein [Candidatus Erginobacter occultus]
MIPAFNEEAGVAEAVKGSRKFAGRVLVVDDGSADRTGKAAAAAGAEVIRHPVNRGKGAALRTGLRALAERGCDPVIILDGDGQHDPAEIPAFLDEASRSGAEIVVGNRMSSAEGMPFVRYWTNRTMSAIISRLAVRKVPDTQCGYRLLSAAAIDKLTFATSNYDTESEMLIEAGRKGIRISSVPVRTIYTGQVSKIRPGRDTVRFLRLLLRTLFPGKE